MKNLIYALLALVCGVYAINAGETQEMLCGDKSLSYCIKHYDKQCKAKNYSACFAVGTLYYKQKQYGESKKYFEMVCDKANSKDSHQIERIDGSLGNKVPVIGKIKIACSILANFYDEGLGVRQDFVKAFHYYNKACDFGEGNSCGSAGFKYHIGEGVKQDVNYAIKLYTRACELEGSGGCVLLGVIYRDAKKNLSKAKALFGKACDLGEQHGCDYYKKLNEKGVK